MLVGALCLVSSVHLAASSLSPEVGGAPNIGTLAAPVLDPDRLYWVSAAGAFYRTEDGGESWETVRTSLSKGPWATIAVWPHDAHTVYALDRLGTLLFSSDGGDTFEVRQRGVLDEGARLTVDPEDPWTLYAETLEGIRLSRDGGVTWNTLAGDGTSRFSLASTSSQIGFVATCEGRAEAGGACFQVRLDGTKDGGETWTPLARCDLTQGLKEDQRQALEARPASRPIHQLLVDQSIYLATWLGLFELFKSGQSCQRVSERQDVLAVAIQGEGANARTLWLSRRAVHLRRGRRAVASPLIGERSASALALNNRGAFVLMDDGSLQASSGKEWIWLRRPPAVDTRLHLPETKNLTTQGPRRGSPGRPIEDPIRALHLDNHVGAVLFHPDESATLLAGTLKGVFVSRDLGHTWERRSTGLWPTDVHVLELDRHNNLLYAGTHGGGIYVSDDLGRSWQRRSSGLNGGEVTSLRIDPERPETLVATVSGNLYMTHDQGLRWRVLTPRLPRSRTELFLDVLPLSLAERGREEVLSLRSGGHPLWMSTFEETPALNLRDGKDGPCAEEVVFDGMAIPMSRARGRQLLLDEVGQRLYVATDMGLWSTSWKTGEGGDGVGIGRSGARCGTWIHTPGSMSIQALAMEPSDRSLWAATAEGLTRWIPGEEWQGVDLEASIHSVAVDPSGRGGVMAGDDRGSVWLSFDGGESWRRSVLPRPFDQQLVGTAYRDVGNHWQVADLSGMADSTEAQIRTHLQVLPKSAHRERLRWWVELWGRGALGEVTPGLLEAVHQVANDAASQLRSLGLRDITLAGEGRWMIARYSFDDGTATHDETRIFDLRRLAGRGSRAWLRSVADRRSHQWKSLSTEKPIGIEASKGHPVPEATYVSGVDGFSVKRGSRIGYRPVWKDNHDLAIEPSHGIPTWQLVDAGDLLATSLQGLALVTRSRDGDIELWNLRQDVPSPTLPSDGTVRRPASQRLIVDESVRKSPKAAFSHDGRWLLVSQATGFADAAAEAKPRRQVPLHLLHLATDPTTHQITATAVDLPVADATAAAMHPKHNTLALAGGGLGVSLWPLDAGQRGRPGPSETSPFGNSETTWKALRFSPGGEWLASLGESVPGAQDSETRSQLVLRRWVEDTASGRYSLAEGFEISLEARPERIRFSHDGSWLAVFEDEETGGHLWDLRGASPRLHASLGADQRFLSFLQDDRLLIRGRDDVEIWSVGSRLHRETTLGALVGAKTVLGGLGVLRDAPGSSILATSDLTFLPGTSSEDSPERRPIRLSVPGNKEALQLYFQGDTLVAVDGYSKMRIWRFGKREIHQALVQIGRYDTSHEDAAPASEAFLELFSLLKGRGTDLDVGHRREVGGLLCHLAGGSPSRGEWRRVLGTAPYAPTCRLDP